MKRSVFIIFGLLALIILGGYVCEQLDCLRPLKRSLRTQSVPTSMLDTGSFGKILKKMGAVKSVPAQKQAESAPPRSADASSVLFKKKRQTGGFEFQANPGGREVLPGSRAVKPGFFRSGWPLISIVIDENELNNPDNGLLTFPRARGRKWERLAYVSYYENRKLLFASGAGLRLHGGSSRTIKNRTSYRLYFRKEYGTNRFTPGIFSSATDPLKRLVVHADWPLDKPFTTCLAFDIARRMGCVVPEVKPALLIFNGKPKGIYFIAEHLGTRQWRSHFKHKKFLFKSYRGRSDDLTEKRFARLAEWCRNPDTDMTMSAAAQHVDLDNLSRNLFSYVFCGTDDWIQGTAALDLKKADGRWFWINWDMDRSFWIQQGARAVKKVGPIWEKFGFEFVLNPAGKNVRTVLCRRLVSGSAEYRKYFVRLMMDLMNHRINDAFLSSRVDHYRRLAVSYGKKNLNSLDMMARFCKYRPDFIRKQMQKYFSLERPFLCRIKSRRPLKLKVDGYRETGSYQGWYFRDSSIEIEIIGAERKNLSHWLVNGKKIASQVLRWPVKRGAVICPVFSTAF